MNDQEYSKIIKLFYSDGYKLGMEYASEGFIHKSLEKIMIKLYSSTDGLIESVTDQAEKSNVNIDCRAGCSWCCNQAVFALSHEIEYLGNYIKSQLPASKQEEISQRAIEKNEQTHSLDSKELLNFKHPCPLLQSNKCMVYEARPMACRIYLSKNEESCKDFYYKPESKETYPQLLEFPLKAGRMMNEGFKSALKQNGRNVAEFTIEKGLKIVLDNI